MMRQLQLKRNLGFWYYIKTKELVRLTSKNMRNRHFKFTVNAKGLLIAPDGACWQAVSGPHGKGALPDGIYYIHRPKNRSKLGYQDFNGNCWFAWIESKDVKKVHGRDQFGIHPDGWFPDAGIPYGTMGCIGLTDVDTSPARDALQDSTVRYLIVRHKGVGDEDVVTELALAAQGF
jgi:hypothetical protein